MAKLVQKQLKHQQQIRNYNCASASLAVLLGKTQEETAFLCETRTSGTHMSNVAKALRELGSIVYDCYINQDFLEYSGFLEALSYKWPLLISGEFHSRYYKSGRDSVRHHACAVADGMIYDPSEPTPLPVQAYGHTFTKYLTLIEMIIIEEERPFYLRSSK